MSLLNSLPIAALVAFTAFAPTAFAARTEDYSSQSVANVGSYADAKALAYKGQYAEARDMLKGITTAEPANADAWNMLGYSNRKMGDLKAASRAYSKALKINPDHLGALEYQGEMFIQTGDAERARANLVKLQGLCGNCEELEDLQKAMTAAGIS